jgi:hypothetical protein
VIDVDHFPKETWDGFSTADLRQLLLDAYDELLIRRRDQEAAALRIAQMDTARE